MTMILIMERRETMTMEMMMMVNDDENEVDDVEIGLDVVDSTDDAKLRRLSTAEKEEAAQVHTVHLYRAWIFGPLLLRCD